MVKKSTDMVLVQGVKMPRWQAETYEMPYTEVLTLIPDAGAKRHAPSTEDKKMIFLAVAGGFVGGLIAGAACGIYYWLNKNLRIWR